MLFNTLSPTISIVFFFQQSFLLVCTVVSLLRVAFSTLPGFSVSNLRLSLLLLILCSVAKDVEGSTPSGVDERVASRTDCAISASLHGSFFLACSWSFSSSFFHWLIRLLLFSQLLFMLFIFLLAAQIRAPIVVKTIDCLNFFITPIVLDNF